MYHTKTAKIKLVGIGMNKKVTAAQDANEYDLAGHAAKAKDLLAQAYAEIKLAAEAANK